MCILSCYAYSGNCFFFQPSTLVLVIIFFQYSERYTGYHAPCHFVLYVFTWTENAQPKQLFFLVRKVQLVRRCPCKGKGPHEQTKVTYTCTCSWKWPFCCKSTVPLFVWELKYISFCFSPDATCNCPLYELKAVGCFKASRESGDSVCLSKLKCMWYNS